LRFLRSLANSAVMSTLNLHPHTEDEKMK